MGLGKHMWQAMVYGKKLPLSGDLVHAAQVLGFLGLCRVYIT